MKYAFLNREFVVNNEIISEPRLESAIMLPGLIYMDTIGKRDSLKRNIIGGGKRIAYLLSWKLLGTIPVSVNFVNEEMPNLISLPLSPGILIEKCTFETDLVHYHVQLTTLFF